MFEELGWHLALLPTESDDTIKRFPLHFPGTRNSRGGGRGGWFSGILKAIRQMHKYLRAF